MSVFNHQHTAHCETGVMSSMLRHFNSDISEPMALGLSSSIAFAYLPMVKLNGLPLIAYRMPPKSVIKGLQKTLKLDVKSQRFSNEDKAIAALDEQLAVGNIVGLQTGVFWLEYFPEDMRFHFNAHNLIVYGKEGDEYLISDPVFESPVRCSTQSLKKARFSKGALAPKGQMYFLQSPPKPYDLAALIPKSIKATARKLTPPVPIIGMKGIEFLAKKIEALPSSGKSEEEQFLFLGHIIRMQEEIGTGGAGFRYIYASFLQESAVITGQDCLREASEMMTDVGDLWRTFALHTVKMCKGRSKYKPEKLAGLLRECAQKEREVWNFLKGNVKT